MSKLLKPTDYQTRLKDVEKRLDKLEKTGRIDTTGGAGGFSTGSDFVVDRPDVDLITEGATFFNKDIMNPQWLIQDKWTSLLRTDDFVCTLGPGIRSSDPITLDNVNDALFCLFSPGRSIVPAYVSVFAGTFDPDVGIVQCGIGLFEQGVNVALWSSGLTKWSPITNDQVVFDTGLTTPLVAGRKYWFAFGGSDNVNMEFRGLNLPTPAMGKDAAGTQLTMLLSSGIPLPYTSFDESLLVPTTKVVHGVIQESI